MLVSITVDAELTALQQVKSSAFLYIEHKKGQRRTLSLPLVVALRLRSATVTLGC